MNASKTWINLSFLIVIVAIGISGGFASTANYASEPHQSSQAFDTTQLIAYSNIKPGKPHFGSARESNQTSRLQQSTTVSASCLRVNHLSKPISVYRNRFCTIESGDRQLAQATQKQIVF